MLVKCMSNPVQVPECIKALSSTTFVAEVKAPALAVLVPFLLRALNDRSMEVQRRTVVVIDNLVKLVRNPKVAARYLSPLVGGVERIKEGASFPEVCLQTLVCRYLTLLIGSSLCNICTCYVAKGWCYFVWYYSTATGYCSRGSSSFIPTFILTAS